MIRNFIDRFSSDMAIDLGTANTLVMTREKGLIINEPSVVAVQRNSQGQTVVLSVGKEAKKMLGRTPGSINAIRPMRNGVIADFEVTQTMLSHFIKKAKQNKRFVRPRVVICIPFGITPVEKRAVKESTQSAGAREVYLIEEPMAAAIGAGLPITEATGNMIVNIGGGTTEVAIISLGGIVYSRSVRVAGDAFNEAIMAFVKKKYSLLIGERTAEDVKIAIGNAYPYPDGEEPVCEVKGRDLVSGGPKTIELNSTEVREALHDPLSVVIDAIKVALERTPPELAADIVDNGIILSGGGALLTNIDLLIKEKTGLPVALADDPLTCVVRGARKVLDDFDLLRQISLV